MIARLHAVIVADGHDKIVHATSRLTAAQPSEWDGLMGMEISCDNCGAAIAMRERVAKGWTYHAGPPVKHFCDKPQCQDAYRDFVDQTKPGSYN